MGFRLLIKTAGLERIFRETVEADPPVALRPFLRDRLTEILASADQRNPFFRGRFSHFLRRAQALSEDAFFKAYSDLPAFSKEDYIRAGDDVLKLDSEGNRPVGRPFRVSTGLLSSLRLLRRPDFFLPMATGGSSRLPLTVKMTRQHAVSMLFTFFKCWRKLGWKPGSRILVFYPKGTYNIDDLALWNRFDWLSGFRLILFSSLDEPTIRNLVSELNSFDPDLLLIFPSVLNFVSHRIRMLDLPLRAQPRAINVSGETFFDCQRRNIARVFPASRVEDSYGSVELGEIAHESGNGLEIFSDVAYVETQPNAAGMPELVITRLGLTDFPFIRYKMRDIARVEFETICGRERFMMRGIEGKDENHLTFGSGGRLFPSFFNRMVNEVNGGLSHPIAEVKAVQSRSGGFEIRILLAEDRNRKEISSALVNLVMQETGGAVKPAVSFVEDFGHDYRRKYRVIERGGEIEYAGGVATKM